MESPLAEMQLGGSGGTGEIQPAPAEEAPPPAEGPPPQQRASWRSSMRRFWQSR